MAMILFWRISPREPTLRPPGGTDATGVRVAKQQEGAPSAFLRQEVPAVHSATSTRPIGTPTDFRSSDHRAELQGQSTARTAKRALTGFWCMIVSCPQRF